VTFAAKASLVERQPKTAFFFKKVFFGAVLPQIRFFRKNQKREIHNSSRELTRVF